MSISSTNKSKTAEIYAKKQAEQQKLIEDKLLYVLQEAYGTNKAYQIYREILNPQASVDDVEELIIGSIEEEDSWYDEEDEWFEE